MLKDCKSKRNFQKYSFKKFVENLRRKKFFVEKIRQKNSCSKKFVSKKHQKA